MRAGSEAVSSTDEKIQAWILAARWIEEGAERALRESRSRTSPSVVEERAIKHALAVVAPSVQSMATRIQRNRRR